MFGFKKKEYFLSSVADGEIIPISQVADDVFSQKILGDGFAVKPRSGSIFSPADGTVTEVSDTLHAYCITSDDGLEILVHIGIDTVELKGEGFTSLVKKGSKIKRGTPLAYADIDAIQKHGYNPTVVVVVTNTHKMKSFEALTGVSADAGDDSFRYSL